MKTNSYPQYLICKCTPLEDQWECDCRRSVSYVTTDRNEAFKKKPYKFEVYGISASGMCVLIKDYE